MTDNKQEILTQIEEKLAQATALINECKDLAEKNEVEFSWYSPSGNYETFGWAESNCSNDSGYQWTDSSSNC